jgi:hypothetical protein
VPSIYQPVGTARVKALSAFVGVSILMGQFIENPAKTPYKPHRRACEGLWAEEIWLYFLILIMLLQKRDDVQRITVASGDSPPILALTKYC